MLRPSHIKEGVRFGARALAARFRKPKTYIGDAPQICKQIVQECWNGTYYQVSTGNFPQFWMRDFGLCVDALLALGYREQVVSSLSFALEHYQRANRITTFITKKGKCVDFPVMAIDSLPFLLHSLVQADAQELVQKYKDFLEAQLRVCYQEMFDMKTGLVRKDKHFSSIKDHYARQSSCYDNCMLAMAACDAKTLKLTNPFTGYDFTRIIKETFWTGTYFLDDLSGKYHVASDANIFPFWCGIFTDKEMLASAVGEMKAQGLDKPFPAKYTQQRIREQELFLPSFFASNYEGNSIWTHLGFCFIDVVMMLDKKLAQPYVRDHAKIIEKHKNVLEVFNPDGTPYKRLFYVRDEGMLWAAMFLKWS
ncbi:hypothetical protein HY639_01160 [Candidatus Woesearchaeota archaeon]|nr:hypothetical protein [Candidatus Woesearchaeota archaeon]